MDLREVSGNSNKHPWELSRARCILKEITRIEGVERVLDVGCGDGFFDRVLLHGDARVRSVLGYDVNLEKPYSEGACSWTNDIGGIPDGSFDLILMMDVLEHVEDDASFLRQIGEKLKPGGTILITVPAFMKLFSLHDTELKHFRRYNRKTLQKTVADAGFVKQSESYFYLSLILLRILTKNKTQNLGTWKYGGKSLATRSVRLVLNMDYDVLRFLSRLRIFVGGLSLLMIVKKREYGAGV